MYLQRIPLFAGLSHDQVAALVPALERRTYRRGQVIIQQGEAGSSLYVIISGQVRIYTLSLDGHELSFSIYGAGDFFGEMSLLDGEPRSANAQALRHTDVLVLHRRAFLDHLVSNPHSAICILETLNRRLRRTTENAEGLMSLSVTQRLARKLLELAAQHGVRGPDGILIDLELSQEAVASLVGTTRESANRALSGMREQGIVQVERGRIREIRPDLLEAMLAQP